MKIGKKHYRTIWIAPENKEIVKIINQKFLPHLFRIETLYDVKDVAKAIRDMHVRGAGLIGATAGYGMYLATLHSPKKNFERYILQSAKELESIRPTAVNLSYAVNKQLGNLSKALSKKEKIKISFETAEKIADEDAESCRKIGEHGIRIIQEISKKKKGKEVNILTHCNAGWLAFVDYGSALSPVYKAFDKKIPIRVFVDETRPKNQGALTAWELKNHGIPYTFICDNEGGYLMQKGLIDMVIVGADRVTKNGDVANKIGTYLKALAAKDNNIPFYVAFPLSTFDKETNCGSEIPIEKRSDEEVKYVFGKSENSLTKILIPPKDSGASNHAFDITPKKLITSFITEKGICKPDKILQLAEK